MSLDVGVIPTIKYLERPDKKVYDFIWHLNLNADEADWSVSSGGNTIVEYEQENMFAQMEEYITDEKLVQDVADGIRKWVGALPWQDDVVMLHFSW